MATRGILQRDVANALGISQAQASARIRGAVDWRLSELQIVARLCLVDLADLVNAPCDYQASDDSEQATA